MPTQADLDRRFDYHRPDDEKGLRHQKVRDAARTLAEVANTLVRENREQSLAFTKIEEAMFWLNAAIAREDA